MACRTLDVTLVRAEDLQDVNIITSMAVYAVVSISGDPRTRQRTPIHVDGHCNPRWNHSFHFTIPSPDPGPLALHVALCSERLFGVSDIGDVYIPLRDLLDAPADSLLGFPVRCISGSERGCLVLSYKAGGTIGDPASKGNSLVRPCATKPAAMYDEPPIPGEEEVEEAVDAYPPPPPYGQWGPYAPAVGYPPYPPPYWYDAPRPPPKKGYRYDAPPPKGKYGYDALPPPSKKGYQYDAPPPPKGKYGYDAPPPPSKKGYRYDAPPPPKGKYGYDAPPPPPPPKNGRRGRRAYDYE